MWLLPDYVYCQILLKNERASMETPFSNYKSMGNFLDDFMHVLVTCKYKKDRIKDNREKVETPFPHYKSMGAFCYHGHQSFDPICLKTLCSLSPTQVMLHIKFDQNWPTGHRDIKVRKCKIFVIQGQVLQSE